jgi:isoamylase
MTLSIAVQVFSGQAYPLGATPDEEGTNFALFSANATKVVLCLFDQQGEQEIEQILLPEFSDDVWHGYVQGIKKGTLYGYRVYGPFEPHNGHRFNPDKLLIDPYAKQLKGNFLWSDTHLSYDPQSAQQDLTLDCRDNAKYMPKCVVKNSLDLVPDQIKNKTKIKLSESIIYEIHVKGFTQQNSNVPVELRGTFKGLAEKNIIDYLVGLGITSVELMPAAAFFDESFLLEKGLKNYWGYNSIAFFAPEPRYCFSDELSEFSELVQAFHQAGIEVILDVVYNHTAEGDHLGPTYSFKGIDNASYYRLEDNDRRYYKNHSGCGNTLNLQHPRVLQLVMDSLRYWVEMMGVDGFRFDLAPILGRGRQGKDDFVDYSSFFAAIRQDPVLANVKLIAEPWDVGPAGYQLGRFPHNWLEWNDRFRDTVRRFWRGDQGMLPELAKRLHGSNDIFSQKGRRPYSSVNYVTSHDGFTLDDLVSYKYRHNQANGETGNDGHLANFSENYGAEGQTSDQSINEFRAQQKRNILATLLLAQGTPMLLAGDEFGNSQSGNNNAYCQDNKISWLDWSTFENIEEKNSQYKQYSFVKKLIQLRKEHPLLNRNSYQHGNKNSPKTGLPDISWLSSNGHLMNDENWHDQNLKCFGMLLADVETHLDIKQGQLIPNEFCSIEYGQDDALLIILNAHEHNVEFFYPGIAGDWKKIVDTACDINTIGKSTEISCCKQDEEHFSFTITANSCVVLTYNQHQVVIR